MARSIVLRFDATCFDCGASLSAGTTARWFGKGRVSCCGGDNRRLPDLNGPAVLPPRLGTPDRAPAPLAVQPPGDSAAIYRAALAAAPRMPEPIGVPSPFPAHVLQLASLVDIAPESLAAGLNPVQLTTLADKAPHTRLVVRLSSGARFIVPAVHAHHVIRCVAESCVDRIRDVALLAEGSV